MNEEVLCVLEDIANSLRTLAEVTKANSKLKQELQESFMDLELSIKEIKEDPFGLKESD